MITKRPRLFLVLATVFLFALTIVFPRQILAASISNRVAVPVPIPPGTSLSAQWGVSLNPGESVTKSALRWTIGQFSNYQSASAYTSSSRSLGNAYYQGSFCIPSGWSGKTQANFIQMGAWALINGWRNIYQPAPTIVPQAVYDDVGAVGSVTQVNNRPYEARYQGGSRNWRYSGGQDKTTAHSIANAFSQTVMQTQREGISRYEIKNWGAFRARYKINFYFADFAANGPGQRVFDIFVNSQPVTITINDQKTTSSANFDVYKEADGKFRQVKISFFAESRADSNTTITFVSKSWRSPILNAADITALSLVGAPCNGGTTTPSPTPSPNPTPTPAPLPDLTVNNDSACFYYSAGNQIGDIMYSYTVTNNGLGTADPNRIRTQVTLGSGTTGLGVPSSGNFFPSVGSLSPGASTSISGVTTYCGNCLIGTWTPMIATATVDYQGVVTESNESNNTSAPFSIDLCPNSDPIPTPTPVPPTVTPTPTPTPPVNPASCPLDKQKTGGFITNNLNNQWKNYAKFIPGSSGWLGAVAVRVGNWGGAGRQVSCKITNNQGTDLSAAYPSASFRKSDGRVWEKIILTSPVSVNQGQAYRLYCRGPDSWGSIYWLKDFYSYDYKTFVCSSGSTPPTITPTPTPTATPTPTPPPTGGSTIAGYVYQESASDPHPLIRPSAWSEPLLDSRSASIYYRRQGSPLWIGAGAFSANCSAPFEIKNLSSGNWEVKITTRKDINGASVLKAPEPDSSCRFTQTETKQACTSWYCNHSSSRSFTIPVTVSGGQTKTVFFSLR